MANINNTKIIDLINEEIQKNSLLKHEFYQLWQQGKLTRNHLAGYSKEYFQIVKTVPLLLENTLMLNNNNKYEKLIENNLRDEIEHVDPWINFAQILNVKKEELTNYQASGLTKEAINDLLDLSKLSFEEAVASIYAFEKELPKISETKLSGLKEFYGIEDKEGIEYFNIHKEVDIYHSKIWENILTDFSEENYEKILNAAKRSLKAQNKLLDSVKDKYLTTSLPGSHQ